LWTTLLIYLISIPLGIRKAVKDGSNIEGRSATLTASTMAGLAFTNTGVGVIHALAHTIGGRFNTHHGMTNGVFLPHGMEFNLPAAKDKYAKIARYLGDCTGSNDDRCASKLIEKLRALLLQCSLPTTLRELGVRELSEAEIVELAEIASTDPAIMFNAKEVTVEDLIELIKRAY
ncbi:MAG: iron-containing alcohol dehydrogenase, partial [Gammaproteobacteria bacterium]|nr:iron-containing alcohol dehydrogenase [Gammaproteobacteria bacterium]